jgi:hypothetical protein
MIHSFNLHMASLRWGEAKEVLLGSPHFCCCCFRSWLGTPVGPENTVLRVALPGERARKGGLGGWPSASWGRQGPLQGPQK